jgi:hypothetical protein
METEALHLAQEVVMRGKAVRGVPFFFVLLVLTVSSLSAQKAAPADASPAATNSAAQAPAEKSVPSAQEILQKFVAATGDAKSDRNSAPAG